MSITTKLARTAIYTISTIAPSWTAEQFRKLMILPGKHAPKEFELKAEKTGTRFTITDGISAIRWLPTKSVSETKKALLAHGWEGRATQMAPLVPALLARGYEVIAVDMPAHGQSTGRKSQVIKFKDTLLEAEKEEGPFDLLLGHSMGAIASTIAISEGFKTGSFVMISSPTRMDWTIKTMSRNFGLSKKATEYLIQYMGNNVGMSARSIDSIMRLSDYHNPLLVIHDHNDKEVPISDAQRLATNRKNTHTFFTTGLGHRRILHSEEVSQEIASFLDKHPNQSTEFLKSA